MGTNGGGFFGANSAHPFENPNIITNLIGIIAMMSIPAAMIFVYGAFSNNISSSLPCSRATSALLSLLFALFFQVFRAITSNEESEETMNLNHESTCVYTSILEK